MLYEADIPVTKMLSKAYIVEIAVDDAADYADDEVPREVPTMAETTKMLRLLRTR